MMIHNLSEHVNWTLWCKMAINPKIWPKLLKIHYFHVFFDNISIEIDLISTEIAFFLLIYLYSICIYSIRTPKSSSKRNLAIYTEILNIFQLFHIFSLQMIINSISLLYIYSISVQKAHKNYLFDTEQMFKWKTSWAL